jgi:peptidoglycan/LPS O-acetylase OafA/YrhL
VFAWPRRGTPAGALVLGVCGSAVIYVATYFPVGVASDFRYSYWAVLAGIAGVVVILSRLFVRDEKLRSAI